MRGHSASADFSTIPMPRWGSWPAEIGWLTGLLVAAILAINVAGLGGIALARRGALEEAERVLRLETAARARTLESLLASARADLAFLTSSPVFFGRRWLPGIPGSPAG